MTQRGALPGTSDDFEVVITRVHSLLGQVGAPGCGLSWGFLRRVTNRAKVWGGVGGRHLWTM